MLRRIVHSTLDRAADSPRVRQLVTGLPAGAGVVRRFVAGERLEDAVGEVRALAGDGLLASVDRVGEGTTEPAAADETVAAYLLLLDRLGAEGLASTAEISVKASALGLNGFGGPARALGHLRVLAARAELVGTTVTVDMEDHTATDATLELVLAARRSFPDVGVALQAALRRTEDDCRALAATGSRVRLCKGAYHEPREVAFTHRAAVDRSYVRCLRVLFDGLGYPMVATHDPRLLEVAGALAVRAGRTREDHEYQMLLGVHRGEQRRLAAAGERVRVYVPFGRHWYPYLVRRLGEKPSHLGLLARSLVHP